MPLKKSRRLTVLPTLMATTAVVLGASASSAQAASLSSLLSSLAKPTSSLASGTSAANQTASNATTAVAQTANTTTAAVAADAVTVAAPDAEACPVQPVSKAFVKVGDQADYALAPGGGFESGTAGWTLVGGAKIAPGNESLGITGGSRSLQLPSGSVAISPSFCVDQTNPHFRFVSRNDGKLSGYQAIVLYRDAAGKLAQAQFTSTENSSVLAGTWGPSSMSPLATKIPLLSSAPTASVQIMFVSLKLSSLGGLLPSKYGTVSIDSVMVDPYRRG